MDNTNHNTETRTNKHLSLKARFYIESRLRLGVSISSIAADLQRSRTTIYYEIKRGTVDRIKKDKLVSLYFAETGQLAYKKAEQDHFLA
ncbi:helix-turn-helix domain-containing protein [Megasphaera lornae]|uniref:helix-turn-helix domain-containing protein n=1 Tax=Megasphaera lornae TaxID=1000568 RepID=UPI0005950AD8|nr:helix-turn-helix domain-containing protein [Megasphaera genomosp. type_1]